MLDKSSSAVRVPATMTEKMLARASGKATVRVGEFVSPDPDVVIIHDGYVGSVHKTLSEAGYRRITNPDRVMFVTDHDVLYTEPALVLRGQNIRRVAKEWQIGRFFDVGQGGHGHIFPMEAGIVQPGSFLFAYDPHCSTFGAVGALALGVLTDISLVLATGTLSIQVPPTVRVELTGQFCAGVHPRDLGFYVAHLFSSGELNIAYDCRVIEFAGDVARRLPVHARVAICNTLTEIGVTHVLFPPKTADGREVPELGFLESDHDATFEAKATIDLDRLEPRVAPPGRPDYSTDVTAYIGMAVTHAYLGSCGSNMYEDFEVAAAMMDGRSVADGVRLFVVPGTVRTADRMASSGLMKTFLDAGALILPAGCGPCAGGRAGPVGPDDVSISTAATNNTGRMGAAEAKLFLGSPMTVAASAVAGRIIDPRTVASALNDGRHGHA
jgi:3-isopropylmalate/(R)-2-methylmalate dehydratase large subunit